jgi:nucleoid-associated protein YgaU
MDKKQQYLLAFMIAIAGSLTLAGCSSSSVSDVDTSEVSADELPVVDADTDQLPDQMDQPAMDDGTVADAGAPQDAFSADSLAPEAPVDVPTTTDAAPAMADNAQPDNSQDYSAQADNLPANSPSFDAPPSMNETAPPPADTPVMADEAPAPSAPLSEGSGSELYEVKGGDTLMKIAFMVYGDVYQWRRILDANSDRISDPARLVKGTQLKVDNAPNNSYYDGYERYLIKSGDTLGIISGDIYGTQSKWKDLWKMNDGLVKDPNRIYAGFFLRYTGGSAPLAQGEDADPAETSTTERNPSSFQEASVPGSPTTMKQ